MELSCINIANKLLKRLVDDFGEVQTSLLLGKYYPEDAIPKSLSEFFNKTKKELSIMSNKDIKDKIGVRFPTEISERQLINLKKAISKANNENVRSGNKIVYKLVGNYQLGQSDLFTWGVMEIKGDLDIDAKIQRAIARNQETAELEKLKQLGI